MKTRLVSLILVLIVMFGAVQPALAAQEGEGAFLPGWFAWLMVCLAIGLPVALLIYLRSRGHL